MIEHSLRSYALSPRYFGKEHAYLSLIFCVFIPECFLKVSLFPESFEYEDNNENYQEIEGINTGPQYIPARKSQHESEIYGMSYDAIQPFCNDFFWDAFYAMKVCLRELPTAYDYKNYPEQEENDSGDCQSGTT